MFSGIWKYLVALAVGAAGIAAIFFKGKSMGGKIEKAKQQEKIIEKVEKAEKVRRAPADPKRKRVSRFDRK